VKLLVNNQKIKMWGFLTPISTKKNKERTKKMKKAQKITIKKWLICLTNALIHDSIAPY